MLHFTIKYHISDWLNNCTNSMFVGGKKKNTCTLLNIDEIETQKKKKN